MISYIRRFLMGLTLTFSLYVAAHADDGLQGPPPQRHFDPATFMTYVGGFSWKGLGNVAIQDSFVFATCNYGIQVLDVADPAVPQLVSRTLISESPSILFGPQHISVHGDLAVCDAWNSSGHFLYVYDVSDPQSPQRLARYTNIGVYASKFHDSLVYFVADDGLKIVDLSNPAQFRIIGQLSTLSLYAPLTRLDVLEGRVAIASQAGIHLIDTRDVLAPTEQGTYPIVGGANDVVLWGDLAAVATRDDGVLILDLANPSTPQRLVTIPVSGEVWRVDIQDNQLAVAVTHPGADGYGSLMLYDISDPSTPRWLGTYSPNARFGDFARLGNFAVVPLTSEGLAVLDLTRPDGPTEWGRLDMVGYATDLALNRSKCMIALGEGWELVNLENPQEPIELVTTKGFKGIEGVFLDGRYGFAADHYTGLHVFDLADPRAPQTVGHLELPEGARTVCVQGDVAYVTAIVRLQIVDLKSKTQPTLLSTLPTLPGMIEDVKVLGNYAYLANQWQGLQVVDVSNPREPAIVAALDTPGYPLALDVRFGRAYLADYDSGLQIIDVSNPLAPTFVSRYQTPDATYGVAAYGSYVFLALGRTGVQALDISDPRKPKLVGTLDTPHFALDVSVQSDHLLVADGVGVLVIALNLPVVHGDADGDGNVDVADAIFLARYLFVQGPGPFPYLNAGDVDCDGDISLLDLVRIVSYLFRQSPLDDC